MAGQFELGAKHQECIKNAKNVISQIEEVCQQECNHKETINKYIAKGFNLLSSESELYNDYLGMTLAIEELSKQNSLAAYSLVDQIVFRDILKAYSSAKPEQILSQGQTIGLLFLEPGFTSISDVQTKAVKSGQGWQLDGTKLISNEQLLSDKYLVLAKDEENALRLFVLQEKDIVIEETEKTISSSKVVMNQAKIAVNLSDECQIAVINDNFENILTLARTLIAAVSVGIAHSSLVKSIEMAKQTKNSKNEALSTSQNIQFTLADMFSEIEAARMLTYLSADSIDNNKSSIKIASMAKVKASEAACNASMETLHLLGNIGFIANSDFAGLIQRAVDSKVKGGTNRVQRSQIYEYMLAKK